MWQRPVPEITFELYDSFPEEASLGSDLCVYMCVGVTLMHASQGGWLWIWPQCCELELRISIANCGYSVWLCWVSPHQQRPYMCLGVPAQRLSGVGGLCPVLLSLSTRQLSFSPGFLLPANFSSACALFCPCARPVQSHPSFNGKARLCLSETPGSLAEVLRLSLPRLSAPGLP